MSDEESRPRSAFRVTLLSLLLAWSACAVYRWQVPPLVEVRATVQVPAATDLGMLCQRPEVKESAGQEFSSTREVDPRVSILSGQIFARKIQDTGKTEATTSDSSVNIERSTESWEIVYRSNQSAHIVEELSALLAVLKQRLQAADDSTQVNAEDPAFTSKVESLEEQLLNNELTLELLHEQQLEVHDSTQIPALAQQVSTLEQEHTDAEAEGQLLREQGRLVQDEFADTRELAAAARAVPSGPISEAIRKLESKFNLSTELTRLNASEQRLSEVYGDRHPKLAEIRTKFEQILAELGGWDEVVDEAHLGEQLQVAIEAVISNHSELETSLAEQLDTERDLLLQMQTSAQQVAERTREQVSLKKELSDLQGSIGVNAQSPAAFTVVTAPRVVDLPWYLQSAVLYVLATVCGLAAGQWIHRARAARAQLGDNDSEFVLPTFSPVPAVHLDLAQRRAARQARLKQAYA